jgi:acetyl esterase
MTRTRRTPLVALAVALIATLSACGPTGSDSEVVEPGSLPVYPEVQTYPDIPVVADIPYAASGETLDLCLPVASDESGPYPAIVVIHGGSWQRGDKSNVTWRSICQWLASEGYVTVSINYRLAPTATFPAQLDDVQDAVRWLRDPDRVDRYDIDPDRIGALGGSAGGNLAALLGTSGTGSLTDGVRVAAVAEFSGPTDLRAAIPTTDSYNQDFGTVVLEYTGCTSFENCPAAAAASPITLVDETDPPFFVAHSIDEFIPLSQADSFVEVLRENSIDTTYVTVEGALHSVAMLDDEMRERVLAFFSASLIGGAAE